MSSSLIAALGYITETVHFKMTTAISRDFSGTCQRDDRNKPKRNLTLLLQN